MKANTPAITKELLQEVVDNQRLRQEVTGKSHIWFFHTYFSHYVLSQPANFHKEIFDLTEKGNITNLIIVAFRGSGKSTIMNMSYPIWSMVGEKKKKFILIVGKTQEQARQHIKNLKAELENNELLKGDFGHFEEHEEEWRAYSITLPKYDAQITAVSTDQSIRGIRYKAHRPDLIICDDIEDLTSVKTQESRDKLFSWLTSELIPAGGPNTQLVMIGNLLHRDSVLMRLKDKIEEGEIDGIFKQYHLIDESGNISWEGKFPDIYAIERERRRIANDEAWNREYMLRIISGSDVVIQNDWIQYYDQEEIKNSEEECRYRMLGVDLAISKNTSADCTSMVWLQIHGYRENLKIYVLPNPVNERLTFLETIAKIEAEVIRIDPPRRKYSLAVETVAYQKAAVEQLEHLRYPVVGISVGGQDKRARLSVAASYIQSGRIVFPKIGCEELINQLVGFGAEKHDDLADAFALAIIGAAEELRKRLIYISCSDGTYAPVESKHH